MDNHNFGQSAPLRASRALRKHQHCHLPENAHIVAHDLVSVRAIASVTEPISTLGEPAVTEDALHVELFARWAQNSRLSIVWEQLDVLDDRADLNNVVDLAQRAQNRPPRQLN